MDITEAERDQINLNAMSQYSIAQAYDWDESNLESTNVILEPVRRKRASQRPAGAGLRPYP